MGAGLVALLTAAFIEGACLFAIVVCFLIQSGIMGIVKGD